MPSQYQRKIAPNLNIELKRLKAGNAAEKQRYENALSAMNKVMADPLHFDFRKNLPQNYKAADVLQQYRLFFRIIPAAEATDAGTDVVFFVWINDEHSIHRTGQADDAYEVFRDKLTAGEIEPYRPSGIVERERFTLHDNWGSEVVYASFSRLLDRSEQHADSHLILSRVTDNSYRIQHVTVSDEDVGLASALLAKICESANTFYIEICRFLRLTIPLATYAPDQVNSALAQRLTPQVDDPRLPQLMRRHALSFAIRLGSDRHRRMHRQDHRKSRQLCQHRRQG